MSDPLDWSSVLTGTGPKKPAPVTHREPDDDLRERLLYVAGDTAAMIARIQRAQSFELDVLAEENGIKRRTVTS